jgi:hypothetical protein
VGAAEIGAEQADELLKVRRERDALRDAIRAFLGWFDDYAPVNDKVGKLAGAILLSREALAALEDKHGK